jgi:parvulin-like peptidyl-prolyl isomerase
MQYISGQGRLIVRAAVALLAVWAVGAAVPSPAEVVDRIVASIDGEPITQSELELYVREHGASAVPVRDVLSALVTEKLLDKEVKARSIRIRSEDVDQYIAGVKMRRGLDDAEFERALRERGLTVERYRKDVQAELEKSELINREIRGRVTVSPEEMRRHYDTHLDDYSLAERVRIRMIMIPVPANASPDEVAQAEMVIRVLHARILAGEDFAELARRYSGGPGAQDGGYLGVFERGQMVEPLEEVAFRLKAGTFSDPIRSAGGFHLLKVEEREGSVQQPFEAVADRIRDELYEDALQRRYERWIKEDLREAHDVEILWAEDES